MRKILLIILIIPTLAHSQFNLYAIRENTDGTIDSFYVSSVTGIAGVFNKQGGYVAPTVDSINSIYGLQFPLAFGSFIKCADGVYRNIIALTGVKVSVIPINANASANLTLTSQPNSEQPLANSQRSAVRIPTGGYTEFRLTAIVMANSASVNSPRIYLQYSTDATNWTGDGTAGNISLTTTGAKETSWITIPTMGDIYVRVAQNGGNGTASPQLGNVTIQLR